MLVKHGMMNIIYGSLASIDMKNINNHCVLIENLLAGIPMFPINFFFSTIYAQYVIRIGKLLPREQKAQQIVLTPSRKKTVHFVLSEHLFNICTKMKIHAHCTY